MIPRFSATMLNTQEGQRLFMAIWPRPTATRKFPAIIIIHANQGLNDYTGDVARRLAKQGYVSLAVDFLSRHGGTKKVNPKGEGLGNIRDLVPW
jgi:carboxymethylenebutenolidase